MFNTRHAWPIPLALLLVTSPLQAEDKANLEVVHRIKSEAFRGSQVMDLMFQLTDVNGSRLTNSPGYTSAAEWARETLEGWGLVNARLEAWGEFGRGWSYSRLHIDMIEPSATTLNGIPLAWCSGTDGPINASVFFAPLFEERDSPDRFDLKKLAEKITAYTDEYRGQLGGKFVLMDIEREFKAATTPASARHDGDALSKINIAPDPTAVPDVELPLMKIPSDRKERRALFATLSREILRDFRQRRRAIQAKLYEFLVQEGVAAVLHVDGRGDGSLIFAEGTGAYDPKGVNPPPSIVLLPEQYNRLARLVEHGNNVTLEIDLVAQFHEDDLTGRNVTAEIRGGAKKKEVVMVGAHLDSWHAGTGASDNAAGSAVMMEAMRILKTLDLRLDRTVRIALWSGEEQGLNGSRGYVQHHFGDPVTMQLQPEHKKFFAYFNVDNGGGKLRGVYLQGNDMARPVFESWLAPFKDQGVTTISIRNTGGTDHLSFDAVGLPGFQFIQDPLDYFSRTHHSNLDVYDHIVPADLMQAAAVLASVVYHAANRPEAFPRKPLPQPLPAGSLATHE